MIRFSNQSWMSALLVYHGGVLPCLRNKLLIYAIYLIYCYTLSHVFDFRLTAGSLDFLAHITIFMLVFRLNQCYSRMSCCQQALCELFVDVRAIIMSTCCYLRSSIPPEGAITNAEAAAEAEKLHKKAVLIKIHCIRLCLAFTLSVKYHTRVADALASLADVGSEEVLPFVLDILRIKSLLTEFECKMLEDQCGLYEEQDEGEAERHGCYESIPEPASVNYRIDYGRHRPSTQKDGRRSIFAPDSSSPSGGTALPPLILQLLRMVLQQPLAEKWGFYERNLNYHEVLFQRMSANFRVIDCMVAMPMPLMYAQECKILLMLFLAAYPLCVEAEDGIWGSLFAPWMLALSMLGLDLVSERLENPLGDDDSDLNVLEMVHALEVDCKWLFDFSEADAPNLKESWDCLGESLGLVAVKKRPAASPDAAQPQPAPSASASQSPLSGVVAAAQDPPCFRGGVDPPAWPQSLSRPSHSHAHARPWSVGPPSRTSSDSSDVPSSHGRSASVTPLLREHARDRGRARNHDAGAEFGNGASLGARPGTPQAIHAPDRPAAGAGCAVPASNAVTVGPGAHTGHQAPSPAATSSASTKASPPGRTKYAFEDFFEWHPLPSYSIKDMINQSAQIDTISKLHGAPSEDMCECQSRWEHFCNMPVVRFFSHLYSCEDSTDCFAQDLADNVFLIQYCIVIRDRSNHRVTTMKQVDAVNTADINDTLSMFDVVNLNDSMCTTPSQAYSLTPGRGNASTLIAAEGRCLPDGGRAQQALWPARSGPGPWPLGNSRPCTGGGSGWGDV